MKHPKTKTNYNYNSYGLLTSVCTYIVGDDLTANTELPTVYTQYSYNTSEGSKIFGALSSETDASGVRILYYYDSTNGRLLATTNADAGTGTSYSYDERGNLVSVLPVTCQSYLYTPITNEESVSYTYNSNNLLSSISTESTTYSFSYDVFGNPTAVNIGEENAVASYWYYDHNGKLGGVTYGNGDAIDYSYNDLDLLTEVWYTADGCDSYLTYEYEYTDDGQVHTFTDHTNFKNTVYKYDQNNRLIGFVEYDYDYNSHEFSSDISYNDRGLLWGVSYDVNYLNGTAEDSFGWSYLHFYDEGSRRLESVSISASSTDGNEYYYYDEYDRVSGKLYSLPSVSNSSVRFENRIDYTYEEYSGRLWLNTSGRITSYTSTVNDNEESALTSTFTYDGNGNITEILYSTGEEIRYVYDNLGQLLREDNEVLERTYVYTYDNAGNILKKQEYEITSEGATPTVLLGTDTYSYNYYDDEWCYFEWGDLLSYYNGHEITYDEIGNPLSYYNGSSYEFSWDGRELYYAEKDGDSYYFTYNDAGIRTSKTKNGVKTTYYVSGSQIAAEKTNGNITVYIYDSEGLPLGMRYHGASYAEDVWDVYWYERNLFGDVVAVYDEAGTKLISYKYDAYGNCYEAYYNGGNSTSAVNNPFRYRGYFYDTDLELYYLNSRYYDCNTGRFISADSALYHSILGYNMYAYCKNNPVNFVDYSGESAEAVSSFFGWLWSAAFAEPTPVGEGIATFITVAAVVGYGFLELGEWIDDLSQSDKKEDVYVSPSQSITTPTDKAKTDVREKSTKSRPPVYKDVPPTEKDGFYHKGKSPTIGETRDGKKKGWVDKNGNIWVPAPSGSKDAHGGGHWDVQRPDGKGYTNVYPGGRIRGGKGKMPIFKR